MSPASSPVILFAGGLLAGVTFVAYQNSFSVPLLFDDLPAIRDNPTIRQLGSALSPPHGSGLPVDGRPVVNLTLAINYAFGGIAVRGYHFVNLAIHMAAALVLFGIVRRTLLQPAWRQRYEAVALPLALTGAALWAVHPLQTQAVTYVSQRAESLMGLLYLLTLYGFIRSADPGASRGWAGLAFTACLLGMATKEVMVSAPLVVLLYDRTFISGTWREAWRRHGRLHSSLAATWLLLGWLVLGSDGRGGTAGFSVGVAWWQYALTQCTAITHYLRLALWPQPLIFDYGTELTARPGEVLPAILIVIGLISATVIALWRRPGLGFAGVWFFAILAPTSSIVPIATQTVAEHRMYLPLAALVIPAILAIHRWLGQFAWVALAGLILAGMGLTVGRNGDYHSATAIWSDTVAKRPDNPRAHCNLGDALFLSGKLTEAIGEYEEALRLKPDYPEAHYNLGNTLLSSGQLEEAIAQYVLTVQLRPTLAKGQLSLANSLAQVGRLAEATVHFEAARRIDPASADVQCDWGTALARAGDLREAMGHFEAALQLRPGFDKAHNNLGNALAQQGRLAEAAVHYDAALRIKPDDSEAHNNLANVLAQQERVPEAVQHYEAAVRLDPNYAEAHNNLGMALAQLNDLSGARKHFEAALRLRPDYRQAQENLSRLGTAGR